MLSILEVFAQKYLFMHKFSYFLEHFGVVLMTEDHLSS